MTSMLLGELLPWVHWRRASVGTAPRQPSEYNETRQWSLPAFAAKCLTADDSYRETLFATVVSYGKAKRSFWK